jgi:hypothetical protein
MHVVVILADKNAKPLLIGYVYLVRLFLKWNAGCWFERENRPHVPRRAGYW